MFFIIASVNFLTIIKHIAKKSSRNSDKYFCKTKPETTSKLFFFLFVFHNWYLKITKFYLFPDKLTYRYQNIKRDENMVSKVDRNSE